MARGFNVKAEAEKFYRKADQWKKILKRLTPEGVKDAAEAFFRSAVQATPQTKRKNRSIFERRKPKPLRTQNRAQTRYDKRFQVVFCAYGRRNGKNSGGTRWFGSKNEARAFAKINFRGIGRAGWFGSLLAMGRPLGSRIRAEPAAVAKAGMVNRTQMRLTGNDPEITAVNKSHATGMSMKESAAGKGYNSARQRLTHAIREAKEKMKAVS